MTPPYTKHDRVTVERTNQDETTVVETMSIQKRLADGVYVVVSSTGHLAWIHDDQIVGLA